MSERTKFILEESQIPASGTTSSPTCPAPPPPPLHPGTGQPVGPDDLAPLFPMELIRQEVTGDPLRRHPRRGARRLQAVAADAAVPGPPPGEAAEHARPDLLQVRGRLPAGSHKPNTAVPQAYYNSVEGTKRLTTETGAGQWGSALAFATAQYGLDCEIWMVRASYDQKPHRRTMMQTWGATVHPSPSRATQAGPPCSPTTRTRPGRSASRSRRR